MGIASSLFGFGTGRTNDPDPVTGLTSRDKYLITTSWTGVRRFPTENGIVLLQTFFKNNPEYIQIFPFKDVPFEELPKNGRFKAHCNSIIYAFSSIVDALGDTDLLVSILNKIGETHAPRKATEQGFLDLKKAIIEVFSTIMKPDEVEAWKKALEVVFSVVITSVKDASK